MALESGMEVMPAVEKPLDKMTTPELLREAAHHGMRRMVEVLRWELDKENIPLSRLVIETANNAGKLLARVEEAGLRVAVAGDAIAELGGRLKALERSQARSAKAAAKRAAAAEKL